MLNPAVAIRLTAMKFIQKLSLSLFRKFLFAGLLACGVTSQAQFSFTNGDVCIALRSSAGINDVYIDAGPTTVFTSLPTGNKITISTLTGAVLKYAFSDTNNLSWSAFAYHDPSFSDPYTLWMTRARTTVGTQSTPWQARSTSSQSQVGGYAGAVGIQAANLASTISAGTYNNGPLFVGSESSSQANQKSYKLLLGNVLNWMGTFQGNPEQSTTNNFTTGGQVVRADFYQLTATTSPGVAGTYLGYFEMNTNGVLTYTSGPSPSVLTAPTIVNITRSGSTNTIYFTTVTGSYSYSLLATNTLKASLSTWPQVGSSITGNGLTNSIQDINTNSPRFYSIKAQ